MTRRPPSSPLFPNPTLFRSVLLRLEAPRQPARHIGIEAHGERAAERGVRRAGRDLRLEEHTSELQSRLHLVCRLLLEKKKSKECCGQFYEFTVECSVIDTRH